MQGRYVRIDEFTHEGGTKNYHVIQLVDEASNTGRLIKRNGPVGKKGQMQKITDMYRLDGVRADARAEAVKREKRGYRLTGTLQTHRITSRPNLIDQTRKALEDHHFLEHDEIVQAIMHWMDGGTDFGELLAEPEPEKIKEDIDRGDVWGSW